MPQIDSEGVTRMAMALADAVHSIWEQENGLTDEEKTKAFVAMAAYITPDKWALDLILELSACLKTKIASIRRVSARETRQ